MRQSSSWNSLRGVTLPLTSAVLVAACYTGRPLETSVPAPTTRIVALITDSGAVAMGNALGPGVHEIEGVITEADPSAWKVSLLRVDQRGGISTKWSREIVTFPRFALTNVREKKLSKKRSWVTAGLVTVGALLAAKLFGQVGADEDTGRPPPPPV